jgi:REP element-mobilizing transposase RayT
MRRPYTQLFCHLVWATWYRLPLIVPAVEPRLYGAIQDKLRELGCLPVAVGGVEDHIHVLCQFPPTLALSYLVQQVKGSGSHLMTHAVIGKESFKWQGSYGAFTVSQDDVSRVRAYVMGQKQHHKSGELWDEWEKTWLPDSLSGAGE